MEQFMLYPIFYIFNNASFYMQIACIISIILSLNTKGEILSTWWGIQNESQYRTLQSMVENYIGKNSTIYFPMIFTIFNQIQQSNQLGMIPYSSTPTVEIVMTLSLSFTLLFGIIFLGFFSHQLFLFTAFLPAGTPQPLIPIMILQETLAYFIKVISQGLRQAINLTTGHVLVKTLVGFIWTAYLEGTSIFIQGQPQFIQTQFQGQEIQICYLQAYIFTFITCITIKDMATIYTKK